MQVRFLIIILIISLQSVFAQTYFREENWIDQLNLAGGLPEKLLSTRTTVFYDYTLTEKELKDTQEYFQRSGIDAVAYYEMDILMTGKDITRAFGDFLTKREISNIAFLEKTDKGYRLIITTYNGKENVVDPKQNAWSLSNTILTELLKTVYRTTANQLKKQNLLINDLPEPGPDINPIAGKRNEFFAIDLKVDPLAVPKFGDEALDKQLEEIFKNNYPLKYKLTEPGLTDKELRKQGSLYVLCIVKGRGSALKEILGYPVAKSESALVSVTYPDMQQQLKNIPSNAQVYKIYFKHIDSGNVFLGTKWDADVTWEQALLNNIKGLKAELKLN
ncbi:hypothetical protein [Ohtaekwangia koreensis]|uniref:Uncharacterized protein n=1 Tax=Ohtaekwangia koreensis TaxID=688867 RepID=A0A1T5L8E6_9BACT|nr:hypothetical protein [Ohtaekwangia koreensis]SKC71668.1 hypothetical protein SAMN05660236_2643 [Ohtaekwangia koreensis]